MAIAIAIVIVPALVVAYLTTWWVLAAVAALFLVIAGGQAVFDWSRRHQSGAEQWAKGLLLLAGLIILAEALPELEGEAAWIVVASLALAAVLYAGAIEGREK